MCEQIARTLQRRPFKVDQLYLSHRCGEIERKNPGRVALYRLRNDSEKKGRENKVKEPDITALRGDTLLFIEIETDSSPKVALGDLHCIDASTHVWFESKGTSLAFDRCLAMVVLEDFKDKSRKEEQFKRLQEALQFCGSVRGARICEISEFSKTLKDLLGIEPKGRSKLVAEGEEDIGDEERIRRAEEMLGHTFKDKDLLLQALTRKDFSEKLEQKQKGMRIEHQEPLATLGDAVLKAILTEHFLDSGLEDKGDITKKRIEKEKNEYLADKAVTHDLIHMMRTTPGERKTGADRSETALATTLEAMIGACHSDGRLKASKKAVEKLLGIR